MRNSEYINQNKEEYENSKADVFMAIELIDSKIKRGLGAKDVVISPMDSTAIKVLLEDCKKRYNYEQHKVVCKNCGREFTACKRTDTYYCDSPAPQDPTKTCKQYGTLKAWEAKIKDETDWHCWYRRVYQSLQMKAKRNPDKPQLKENFDDFRIEANKWKKAVKERVKTENEFVNWLKEYQNMKNVEVAK